jgi:UDPglucose 6-dehydrogenase/UDP-N-acetyl-D-galactosamine dehydrogenase
MINKLKSNKSVVCIIGLGYVGLPLAQAFSKSLRVIGFDIDKDKISRLNELSKSSKETDPAVSTNLTFASDPKCIGKADFIIIAVPTPVTKSKEPDLSFVENAARIVSQNLKKGSTVILESTVYPGVTEEIVKPILEESGLKCSEDFKLGYSPERINPGDEEHAIDKVAKVVAGTNEETAELLAELYSRICPEIFKAKDIKTAEAAKVIENIQRDLNIALMNELSLIFTKMGLSTKDVLETAGTKWNFHRYSPGLVGGHCIPVDPYYLVYKAKEFGYHPQVILAGRAINDYMPKHIAEMTVKALNEVGKVLKGSRVLIMGLAYKENIPDFRESPAKEIIKELREFGIEVVGFDPMLDADSLEEEFNIKLFKDFKEAKEAKSDCIILAVAHSSFYTLSLSDLKEMQNSDPILIDVRGMFDAEEAKKVGFCYRSL